MTTGEFFLGPDLWANILGGFVAAILFAIATYLLDLRKQSKKHKTLQELIEIMGRTIRHRNIGEKLKLSDKGSTEWIREAKKLEEEAVQKAQELSPTAGSLIQWLDRIPEWERENEVEKYVSILSTVIDRIRGLMERNS